MNFDLRFLACFLFILSFTACGDEEECCEMPPEDYREEFVGKYEGTKSNRSFDDYMFTTDVEIEVKLDELTDSTIVINDLIIPIDEDGRFGPAVFGNEHYDVTFSDGDLRMSINSYFPEGIALPCYFKVSKR